MRTIIKIAIFAILLWSLIAQQTTGSTSSQPDNTSSNTSNTSSSQPSTTTTSSSASQPSSTTTTTSNTSQPSSTGTSSGQTSVTTIAASGSGTKYPGVMCFTVINLFIFNLASLSRIGNTVDLYADVNLGAGKLYYNFCGNTILNPTYQAVYQDTLKLMTINEAGSAFSSLSYWELIDPSNPGTGVIMYLGQGDRTGETNYQIIINLYCSQNDLTIRWDMSLFNPLSATNTLTAYSAAACPNTALYSVVQFINSNKYIFGTVFFIFGLFLLLFGLKLYDITVFILAFVSALGFFELILTVLIANPAGGGQGWMWGTLVVSILLASVFAYFMKKVDRVFFVIIGGFLGFIISGFLYPLIVSHFQSNQSIVQLVVITLCILIFSSLAFFLSTFILVLATSVFGSYSVVYGISLFTPVPMVDIWGLITLADHNEWAQVNDMLDWRQYLYLSSILILIIVGFIIQYKHRGNIKTEDQRVLVDKTIDSRR